MVGLMEYKAALFDGVIKEPSVSVPTANGAMPTETPTADPEEDPVQLYMLSVGASCLNESRELYTHTVSPP